MIKTKTRVFMRHQRKAYNLLVKHKGQFGLFLAPGTGKTLVAIRYTADFKLFPALLICRRDDFLTWEDELSQEGYSSEQITIIDKSRKLKDLGKDRTPWTIITYDLLKTPSVFRWVILNKWQIAITDESHMIKRWKSSRTKKVVKATRHIPSRIALSGSPITNDPGDVFSQCLFYDNGKTFGDNYWKFRNRYYVNNEYSHGWYLRSGSKNLIAKKLATSSFYIDEDDAMKLPPKRSVIKSIIMSGAQRRYYHQVLKEWEIEIAGSPLFEIDQVVVQLSKLRQIASGFLYVSDENNKRKTIWFRSAKLKLLKELLTNEEYLKHKPKIVIWCAFTAEILKVAQLAKELKIKAVTFYGSDRKKKDQARKDFKLKPKTRLFIGQVDSGVGMNELTVADTAVYFSNSHKVVSRQQSMRRIRRRGSEIHKQITYWDLITENSTDLIMLKSIQESMSVARMILTQLREGIPLRKVLNAD